MEIFLVRHAIAVERSEELEDELRPLSDRGRTRFDKAVRGLRRLDIEFDHVFHSPWLRAIQTAEMLAPVTRGTRSATALLADDPGLEVVNLARQFALEKGDPEARVAFVGHEPWMAELLSLLTTGDPQHADNLPFKKGAVAWLQGVATPGGAELVAFLPPRALRRLAGGASE